MSAIWGHVIFNNNKNSTDSMKSEYIRKCKLDKINEIKFHNSLIGSGLQFITPEDPSEAMPYIIDNGNIVLTADCILDNRLELIDLLGISDTTCPDGAILCRAYEKWGYDLTKHIKGLFAIAIYNYDKKELFLCTDHTACRCLYYYVKDNECFFSTLLSPIKQLNPDLSINELYIKDFLIVPGLMPNITFTETPIKDVFIIEPATRIIITEKEIHKEKYWEPEKLDIPHNIDTVKNTFLSTYRNAVKSCLRTDGQTAIALSGGFDSSSVGVLAADELAKRGKSLTSYTYVPHYKDEIADQPYYNIIDETDDVLSIAKMYPNIKTNFEDNDGKNFTPYLEELIDVMEIPFKAFVNLPSLLTIYKKAASNNCKVFLNGQCGNSTVSFGDIDSSLYYLYQQKRPLTWLKYFSNYCHETKRSRKKMLKGLLSYYRHIDTEYKNYTKPILNSISNTFLADNICDNYDFAERYHVGQPFIEEYLPLAQSYHNIAINNSAAFSYIGAMETKQGLYTGIVIRDATRSIDIINFCNSIPFEYFAYDGMPRYLIRGAMKDLIPHQILYPYIKTGKQNADWLVRLQKNKNSVLSKLHDIINKSPAIKYYNTNKIDEYLNKRSDFDDNSSNNYSMLFILYVLSLYFLQC